MENGDVEEGVLNDTAGKSERFALDPALPLRAAATKHSYSSEDEEYVRD